MKIRTRITLIQSMTVLSILLSTFILYKSLIDINKLKSVQVSFNKAIDIENEFMDLIDNSLYTDREIYDYSRKTISTYTSLNKLMRSINDNIQNNYKELNNSFKSFYYLWAQKNNQYYEHMVRNFQDFSSKSNGWIPIIRSSGLIKAYDILLDQKSQGFEDKDKISKLTKTLRYIEEYKSNDETILKFQNRIQDKIQFEIEKNIAYRVLFIVLSIIFIILISIYMSMKTSKNLVEKISQVEDSLEKLSQGDLTIHINNKNDDDDEFTLLTDNFNTLTNMLIKKTSSMKEIMNEISSIISESINIDALLIKITKLAKSSSNADAAVILLVDKFSDVLMVEHVEGYFPPPYSLSSGVKSKRSQIEEKFKNTPIPFNNCYLSRESVLKGEPLFIKDTELESDELPLNTNPQDIQFIKSSLTIPLVVSKKLLGVISIAKTDRNETFSDLDYSNLISFVEYVSLTIDNIYKYMELLEKSEMKREMSIASEIQKQLLPKKIPVLPNIDVSAFSDSAWGISGDYYDIYKISKDKSVATVCDVAGKGIPAALVLVIIRTILQLASNTRSSAKDLLTFLNKSISDRVKTDYIATLSILVYDDKTGEVTISIAGDTPILIYRAKDKIVERIIHSEIPIGIDNRTIYTNKTLKFEEDDVLYMFSDGLLEVQNDFNDVFTINELEAFILENSNNRTETITVLLRDYLNEFRGSQKRIDDETVIIYRKI